MVAIGHAPVPWLRPLSWVYGLGVRARNLCFEIGLRGTKRLPVPVVSIGNLSVGGTGKTPFVAWLVARCREHGIRAGVLARGYGRRSGDSLNDEGHLLASRFEGLPQEQGGDRYAAGLRLLDRCELDLIVLDDGFQHRMLHRDVDVCLVDATDPLGHGLLPAGWLREPPRGLDRADVCVLTRTDEVEPAALTRVHELVEKLAPRARRVACSAVPTRLLQRPGDAQLECSALRGRRCVMLAGIAKPARFRRSLEASGAEVTAEYTVRDHAELPAALLAEAAAHAERDSAWLVTTEKDEARLDLGSGAGPSRFVLGIDLVFDDDFGLAALLPEALRG